MVIVLGHYTSKEYMQTTQHKDLKYKYWLLLFAWVMEETKKQTKDQGMILLFIPCIVLYDFVVCVSHFKFYNISFFSASLNLCEIEGNLKYHIIPVLQLNKQTWRS